MSLAMTGSEITIHEKLLVPGDFVPYQILYESSVWQGPPTVKQPTPIPIQVTGAKQFGADPHKATLDKISSALGSLLDKKAAEVVPSAQLINRRDWMGGPSQPQTQTRTQVPKRV